MSCIHVMAETLRQLFDAGQYRMAEWFIDHCGRRQLEELVGTPGVPITVRIDYIVKKRLQKRSFLDQGCDPVEALPSVLNMWCREGRRSAVRLVLGELDQPEIEVLSRHPELDYEVVSMLRMIRD